MNKNYFSFSAKMDTVDTSNLQIVHSSQEEYFAQQMK